MKELLEQFRKEESDLFDQKTGKFYTGITISSRQCELMRDVINEFEHKLKNYEKNRKRT